MWLRLGVNRAEIVNKAEVDQKKSDKKKQEILVWVEHINEESGALLKEVQRMKLVDKDQEDFIGEWLDLIEGSIEKIRKVLK